MANPTFDGTSLFDQAARDLPAPPDARYTAESMPGMDGQFVQLFGTGAGKIRASGLLTAAGATATEAHQNLKQALRQRQSLVGAAGLADYVGTDGRTYDNCLLAAYRGDGTVEIETIAAGSYRAYLPCVAEIEQFVPQAG